jgi:hypothetical protein
MPNKRFVFKSTEGIMVKVTISGQTVFKRRMPGAQADQKHYRSELMQLRIISKQVMLFRSPVSPLDRRVLIGFVLPFLTSVFLLTFSLHSFCPFISATHVSGFCFNFLLFRRPRLATT